MSYRVAIRPHRFRSSPATTRCATPSTVLGDQHGEHPVDPPMSKRSRLAVLMVFAVASRGDAQTAPMLFVSNEGSHDVSVVNGATNAVVATIPVGGRARGIQT